MISAPAWLIGASLLFWGWQGGNWLFGIALALALEVARRASLRFDLGAAEHARIADFCTILFVGLTVVLAVNQGVSKGILAAFQWLPVALSPILAAQLLSASGRVPLSALFRYLRKLKRKAPATRDPLVDVSAVYVVVVVLSAGIANTPGSGYFFGSAAIVGWGLWAVRPRHASRFAWTLMISVGIASGYAGHAGLAQLQVALENWISGWYLRGFGGDPYRSTTDIGSIGRLKLLDAIVLRVHAPRADAERIRLLHRASYNTYVGTTWLARAAPMQALEPESGGLSWKLSSERPQWSASIAARVERGRILLALPAATARISGLAATALKRNALGAVHAELPGDWIRYEVEIANRAELSGPPGEAELMLPAPERATFGEVAAQLGLQGLPVAEAIRRVHAYFRGFSYSTWREREAIAGQTPLGEFMRESRSGHCEYFAAAAALLLRAGGIPARYATGFAVLEYSDLENAWVVRARHAQARTRAWDGARWVDVDTTPPSWFGEEERLAPAWQKLSDLARWAAYRWSQRGELEAGDGWYAALALLVAILAWRLLRGRRVAAATAGGGRPVRAWPGTDSEFRELEAALARCGRPRSPGTPLSFWLQSIAPALPEESVEALFEANRLHQRYRFDPEGLDENARARLRDLCRDLRVRLGSAA